MIETLAIGASSALPQVLSSLSYLVGAYVNSKNGERQIDLTRLSHEYQKKLTEFKSEIDLAIQEKNFERQKALQLELKALDVELARELGAYNRETSLKMIEEKKKSDTSPIWVTASQVIGSNPIQEPISLLVLFSPPVLPYDRMGKAPDGSQEFPKMADFLAQELRHFFEIYKAHGRPADFIYGAWTSKSLHGEAAVFSLFDTLKAQPTLILESSLEEDAFNLRMGYWGLNFAKCRYQSFISGLSWREALNDFAKAHTSEWDKERQKWTGEGKDPGEFHKAWGTESVKRFMSNLQTLKREEQCIENGWDIRQIERHYYWHPKDDEDLKRFLAGLHCLAAGLMADEYFLTDVPRHVRRPPLLPELLPEVLKKLPKSLPEHQINELTDRVLHCYRGMYQYLAQSESCWIPELVLDLAQGLMKLPDPAYAREQIVFSIRNWLEVRQIPFTEAEQIDSLLDSMESALTIADVEYVEKLNLCLKKAGKDRSLNVADACFRRAITRCRNTEYQAAISDFDQAIQLKPEWAEAFYNRGLTYSCLKEYAKAVEDYSESLKLSPNNADAYNNRANAYFKLGEHQKAIDDYTSALNIRPGWAEAEKNRAIVQGVLAAINRKKAEDEELKVKEFEFETVSVDSKGKIISRRKEKARQKIEDLGNGVTLEMVYIPGGTFTMGSPGNEASRNSDEKQHQVTVSPFFMGKYPVTQRQWERIMGNNPSSFKGASRPVENVSWNDAVEFCEKLSRKSGKKYRLPTEAEWEYACRAGTSTSFYFGETVTPDLVNYDGNYPYGSASKGKYRQQTTDVGTFPPNAFGLYDMHGNVWEWCHDRYGDYPSGSVTDPMGPDSGSNRVDRGGSWINSAKNCRSARRNGVSPGGRGSVLGFRPQVSVS